MTLFSDRRPVPPVLRPWTAAGRRWLPAALTRTVGLAPPLRRVPAALEPADVVMIVLNPIHGDNRVLKTARTLMDAGYSVTFIGRSAARDTDDVVVDEVLGRPALLYPEAHIFLRAARTRIAALNWEFAVQYMKAVTWHAVQAIGPRLLHTHDMNTIALGDYLARRLRQEGRQVSWLHDCHEYVAGHIFGNQRAASLVPDDEWREVALAHERAALPSADAVTTVSPLLADRLFHDHNLKERPAVILNSPSREVKTRALPLTVRRKLGLGGDKPLLVYTGGVSPLRGLHTLIEAMGLLPEAHVAVLTEATGAYVESLRSRAVELGVSDRLHWLPYVDPADVPAFIRDATVGVHPMIRYGNSDVALPNKVFDYWAAGLPVVVSDCQSLAGLLRDIPAGEVFKAENPQSLATALQRVLLQPEAYRAVLDAQKEKLRAYDWEAQEQVLLNVYRRLLQKAT